MRSPPEFRPIIRQSAVLGRVRSALLVGANTLAVQSELLSIACLVCSDVGYMGMHHGFASRLGRTNGDSVFARDGVFARRKHDRLGLLGCRMSPHVCRVFVLS